MKVNGDYQAHGYAHIEGLIPPEVAEAFLRQIKADLPSATSQFLTHAPIIKKTSIDIYGRDYPPMVQLLWGLTPAMCALTGRDLLPTYNYFRLYRKGDICRVHSDRDACEHSLSLTLGYADDLVWPFEVARDPISAPTQIEDDFGDHGQGWTRRPSDDADGQSAGRSDRGAAQPRARVALGAALGLRPRARW